MTCPRSSRAPKKPIPGRCFWPFFLFVLVPAAAAGQGLPPAVLGEDDVVRMALARPAVAAVIDGTIDVVRGEAVEAGLWSNPVLTYTREQVLDGGGAGAEDFVTLSQAFDLGGRRALMRRAGRERVRAAALDGAWTQAGVAAEARTLFYEVLLADGRVGAAKAWLARVAEVAAVVGRRFAAGDVSAYDHRRLLREQASAEARYREESAALEVVRSRLAGLLGISVPSDLAVAGTLLPDGPLPEFDVITRRVAERPDVKALAAEASAALLERRAASRGWVPDLTLVGGMKTTRVADDRGWGFVAGVSLPLPLASRGQGEAAQASGRAQVAVGRRDLLLSAAMAEALGLRSQAVGFTEAARVFRRDAVESSEDLARTAEAAYRAGEVGILELLDAWRSVLDASLQALDLEASARRARIELDRMVGEVAR